MVFLPTHICDHFVEFCWRIGKMDDPSLKHIKKFSLTIGPTNEPIAKP